MLLNRLYFI